MKLSRSGAYLSSWKVCPTRFSELQPKLVDFLTSLHDESSRIAGENPDVGMLLKRYGVKENFVSRRGFEVGDYFLPACERKIYQPRADALAGATIQERMSYFGARAKEILEYFYPENAAAPQHLVHVTCTGYISPSAAQLLAAERNWTTEITHAYHMGCYASLPSIRLAMGQVLGFGKTVDLVHTEMCSLHMNPSLHTPEQLVVQTLFADGHVRYRLSPEKMGPSLKVLHIKEKIIPNTENEMTWEPSSHGMAMSLSREVPKRIHDHIRNFVTELCNEAGLSLSEALAKAVFAVHPGGPKIVETIGEALGLQEAQTSQSKKILFEHGNMSSATLPFIWQQISLSDLPAGTIVISLAFGPGLTVFGAVFEFFP